MSEASRTQERTAPTPSPGRLARLRAGLVAAPPIDVTEADRREISILGLRLPRRATAALAIVTIAQILDYSETFMPPEYFRLPFGYEMVTYLVVERIFLFFLLPLLVIVLAFRDRPSRYGLGLGDVRWGLGLAAVGTAVMLPIVVAIARLPEFQLYYVPLASPLPRLVLTNVVDLTASEFFYRGFLLFALVRAIGPMGVLVSTLPFAFAHFGKPDLEVLSTLAGGLAYGWLAWRTGSIWYGAAAHVVIYTAAILAAAAWAG